jgi:hypothetical protein
MVKFKNTVWLDLSVQQDLEKLKWRLGIAGNVLISAIVAEFFSKPNGLKEYFESVKRCPICNIVFEKGAQSKEHFRTHKDEDFSLRALIEKVVIAK